MMESGNEKICIRNHITYILEKMWAILLVAAAGLLNNADSVALGMEMVRKGRIIEGLLAMGGVLVIFFLIALWYIRRWYRTTLTITEGTLVYQRATLKRYVNTIAIANVSNVNLEQNLFEMLVGTCKVKIDTNSLSTADSTDLEMVLKKKYALQLKQMILQTLQEGQEQVNEIEENSKHQDVTETYDIVYSVKQIVINTLLNVSLLQCLLAISFLVSGIVIVADDIQSGKKIIDILMMLFGFLIASFSLFAAIIKTALEDFGFRVRREKDKLHVCSGLLKKKEYTVPINKINALSLEYTLYGRIFRRAYVKVINVGGEGVEAAGVKILLMDSYEELERKLQNILPEYTLPELACIKRQPVRTLVWKMLRFTFCYVLFCLGAWLGAAVSMVEIEELALQKALVSVLHMEEMPYIIAGAAGVWVLWMLGKLLAYWATGMYQNEQRFVVARGIFARQIKAFAFEKIQYLTINQGPVERRLGLSRGKFSILASVQNQVQSIGLFSLEDFESLEEKFYQNYHKERGCYEED